MLQIRAGEFIEVERYSGHDNLGQGEIQLEIKGSPTLYQMKNDIMSMQAIVAQMQADQHSEAALKPLILHYKICMINIKRYWG